MRTNDPRKTLWHSTKTRSRPANHGLRFEPLENRYLMTAGDFNADGLTNHQDINSLCRQVLLGTNEVTYDLNADGVVDSSDMDTMILDVVGTLFGDANLDYVVDASDFNAWNANKFEPTGSWETGDFNCDRVVDVSDFQIWNNNKFQRPWAFEETFDGDPDSPSQDLLPDHFDYVVTHRTHPQEHFTIDFPLFPADHGDDCSGPDPNADIIPQHMVRTDQTTNGDNPDESFFVCKNHMMSSMGEVGPYSIGAFWPRQEFNFADGGKLEFDVNINLGHENRSWWEIMIVPRDQLKVAAGPTDSAIDETYPEDRIVFDFRRLVRRVKVGTGDLAPAGWVANEREFHQWDWAYWNALHPNDPALTDRRIRRTMRFAFENEQITWGIETEDGSFDEFVVDVPGGLPFDQGLVVFKTHAYTPHKNNNFDTYTFHWDNIRFDGPVVGKYETHYADEVVYLQRNGDRPIGDSQTVNITLDEIGPNPALFGQIHQHKAGQVELRINGGPTIEVNPFEYAPDGCPTGEWNDWKSFRLELDPADLVVGTNTLTWTVGERPSCHGGPLLWDGFSVKSLHIQTDIDASANPTANDAGTPGSLTPWSFDRSAVNDVAKDRERTGRFSGFAGSATATFNVHTSQPTSSRRLAPPAREESVGRPRSVAINGSKLRLFGELGSQRVVNEIEIPRLGLDDLYRQWDPME